jgi:hypothetical protein
MMPLDDAESFDEDRQNNLAHCDACGRPTHVTLLDGKPDPNDPPNWNRIECMECYGPGWACVYPEGHPERLKAERLTKLWRMQESQA